MKKHMTNKFDDEEFSPSDSEEEYTENEKRLLNKVRSNSKEESESENEVFGIESAESDTDDNKSDLALSDVEGQGVEDDLPDVRAWGKDKRKFYKTDYVDQDYGGFQGKDAHLAELEEQEANNLQKQLAEHLDEDDFALDLFPQKVTEEEKPAEEVVKTDFSKLSKRQKLQILQKESPEFFSLVEDYRAKMTTAKEYLYPLLQKYKSGHITKCQAVHFVETLYKMILNYCTNIYMYLYLKSAKVNVQNHPVIKRLYQYRQLLLQLEPVFEETIKDQIEIILSGKEMVEQQNEVKKPGKKLKILTSLVNSPEKVGKEKKKRQVTFSDESALSVKKTKLDDNKLGETEKESDNSEDEDKIEEILEDQQKDETGNDISKRAITYQMAKNKGLTPHRKKEQRNPRVKHKLKYRKAVIRRKGAVREPRKELKRYSGEISGIKSTVSRSIKIK